MIFRATILCLLAVALLVAAPAIAADSPAASTVTTEEVANLPPPPSYDVLRFDEDYSVLSDGPRADWLDYTKFIPVVSPAFRATFGGQVRWRFEHKGDEVFGSGTPPSDSYALTRVRVHADLQYTDMLRVFIEGKFAWEDGRDRAAPSIFEDHADFQNLFVDMTAWQDGESKLVFRLGRQELLYGKQRLVSSFVWANVMRTFDGAKVMLTLDDDSGGNWQIDGWWTRLARIRVNRLNDPDPDTQFYGVYATYTGSTKWGYDLYALGVGRDKRTNPNGRSGVDTRMTMGGRFWTKDFAPWDFEAEGAWQTGRFAHDTVSAWMAAVEAGYTFRDVFAKPRVFVGYDYASGDKSSDDAQSTTFNQLFPLGHAYFGYIDVVGRQNIHAVRSGVSVKPLKGLSATLAVQSFWLDENSDGLYNAGGALLRRDTTGNSGSYVGTEIDVTIKYKFDRHSSFLFGYSYFCPGGFIDNTGPSEDIDFVYAQYQFTF